MSVWQGDTILRHNPAGRPVFDWLLALPFLLGVGWCVWAAWQQRAAAVVLLLWTAVMLLPTILAEDTPHFLRAVGLLPAILYFPAIALDRILAFCCQMHQERQATPYALRTIPYTLIPILLLGSLSLTIRDYARYAQDAETGYLFEAAARTLAESVNEIEVETAVYVDDRFWQGWPSLRFLATRPVRTFRPEVGLPPAPIAPAEVYAWPYGPLDFLPDAWAPPALVRVEPGPLARGDLEPAAYSLYTRYTVEVAPNDWPLAVDFDQTLWLRQASAEVKADGKVVVTLVWEGERAVADSVVAFVHLVGPDGLLTQLDAPPGQGRWSGNWWQPGLIMQERRILHLPRPFDPAQHQIQVGLYNALTGERLPRRDEPADYFQVPVDHWSHNGAAPPLR
jgi:hypothetical protein